MTEQAEQAIIRRGRRGDGTIYFEHAVGSECGDARYHKSCTGRWRGVLSAGSVGGKRVRIKISGATKSEVAEEIKKRQGQLREGVRTAAAYTVADCVSDWLADGLDGRSAKTRSTYGEALAPLLAQIGGMPLRDLTPAAVRSALVKIAKTRSTRSIQIAHLSLTRAVGRAVAHRRVSYNAAELAERPAGNRPGRESKAMTRDVALQLLRLCEQETLTVEGGHGAAREIPNAIGAYLTVSLMTGCRPEELRALRWDHVIGLDSAQPSIAVWRSTRQHGDVKTAKSRRTLAIPEQAADALRRRLRQQAADRETAGKLWRETGLVFTTSLGGELDSHNVRRSMRMLTKAAGIGENWTPRELRHTFVSILSEAEVPLEEIARLAGHSTTRTTEVVYRKELRPVLQTGATVMGALMS